MDDTYFTFVNKNRKTFETGDQVFYCYGNRTNKFLLINYGFCFPGNKYDSYEVAVRIRSDFDKDPNPSEIIDLNWESNSMQPIRLKKNQINEVLLGYLRATCKTSFFQSMGMTGKNVFMTRPVNLFYEMYIFNLYL